MLGYSVAPTRDPTSEDQIHALDDPWLVKLPLCPVDRH